MPKNNNRRGGSLASDPYSHLPKQAPLNLPYPAAYDNVISADELIKNYGSVYKTTGGGVSSKKAYSFVNKFIDNRVLDIYLKYLGITTLTPTTLVPVALIFGQEAFKTALKHMKKQEQNGGNIPVLDNALVGTYLKIAGLSKLNLSPHTLIPLGLAMAIYKAFSKKKRSSKQQGGHIAKMFTGEHVPPGFLQLGNMSWNGQTVQNNISTPLSSWQQLLRPVSYINPELQLPCSGDSCSSAGLPAPPELDRLYVDVKGMSGSSSGSDVNNVNAIKPLSHVGQESPDWGTADSQSGVQYSGVDVRDLVLRNQMAGSCYPELNPPQTEAVSLYQYQADQPKYEVATSPFSGGGRRRMSSKRNGGSRSPRKSRGSRGSRGSRISRGSRRSRRSRRSRVSRQTNQLSNYN